MRHPARAHRTVLLALAIGAAASAPSLVAQQPDPHPTFTVGSATARRGEKATGVIAVPAGVDAALDIPVALFHGARPGPVLALVAGAHGTEYASVIAMEQLIRQLDPAKIRGTVIVVPLVNIPSFQKMVPHLNPVDGKNMNRFYPGNPTGTQTERASFAITRQVVEPSDHLVDMHGGDIDESLRPFSYWTVTGHAAQDAASKAMVLAFGLPYIVVSRDRPQDAGASRYLENTASTRGKASFTAEAGHAGTVDASDVDTLVNGSLKLMAHLRMLDRKASAVRHPVWLTEMLSVTATVGGIFYPEVKRDQRVKKGARLGHTTDYLGREVEVATAPADGIVLYVRPVPSMNTGETIAAIGVVGKP